ncbi:MAG: sensor histidine kinase [Lentilitoribacter sp.]
MNHTPTFGLPNNFYLYILALFLSIFAISDTTTFAASAERTLKLSSAIDADHVAKYIDIYVDETRKLQISDIVQRKQNAFQPIKTRVVDVGYTNANVWMQLKLENKSNSQIDWRLYFHENFKQIFHIYIVSNDGKITHVLNQGLTSGFATRPIAYPEIVAPITIAQNERKTVYVQFWTEGSTNLPLSIETIESFTAIATRNFAKQFVFYGMMLILIVAALLAWIALQHAIFPAYIAYAGSTLLYLLHSDGVAFQYLWPGFPAFNSYASVVTGGSYAIFGALYAKVFLSTPKEHPVIDKFLLAIILVVSAMIISGLFIDPRLIKKFLIIVVLVSLMVFTLAAILAARKRFKEVRFYVFAWLGACISASMMTLRHWFGIEISQQFQYDSMRFVMIFDAVMMGLAIADKYNQLREQRQRALQNSLKQAERNLDMTTRLQGLEARYELITKDASRRDELFENTIHDLRQPLQALRLAVHGAMRSDAKTADKQYGDIYDSFDYVDAILADWNEKHEQSESKNPVIDMKIGEILSSIYEMFLPDAKEKQLEFKFIPTSLNISIPPLDLMRIVSNLVSNAVKYTPSGKVLLGVRRGVRKIYVEVHDTGPGLTEEEFHDACKRGMRLDQTVSDTKGKGHGMAIISELAHKNGFEFRLNPGRSSGTSLSIAIPNEPH